jgi:hypothetical protein
MNFATLALRNLTLRKWRTAMLLVGYGLGVATMIVLLSIGEALVQQASDEKLIGGGNITVLPQGIDVEVMKTGGLGGMFFSIDHSRFIYRQLLAGPRSRGAVAAVAPQMTGKLLYLTAASRAIPVLASGEIPSLTRSVNATPRLASGAWDDGEIDRRWTSPTPLELRHEIDRFHLPPVEARGDSTWGEWHYFNVLWPGGRKWAFVSMIVGGAVPDGRWGGQVLVTLHEVGRPPRRFVSYSLPAGVSFSTTRADLKIGESSVTVLPNGDYRVSVRASDEATGVPLTMDVVVAPAPGAFFPGAAIGGTAVVSGYVVPGLRAAATGRMCVSGQCEALANVQSYHDHNWGIWRDVAWEWGEARAGDYTVLYGRIMTEGVADQPLFLYLVDSLGFVGLFRPATIDYVDDHVVTVGGRTIEVPGSAVMRDARGDDEVILELDVEDAAASDLRQGTSQKIGRTSRTIFVQMKGTARLSGRINGRSLSGSGQGFFETYR